MKASIELSLQTREVYQLFKRKINGDRLFIDAILRKFNIVINRCNQQDPEALIAYQQIEQKIQELTKQFTTETKQFELLLSKKNNFDSGKIHFVIQFRPSIIVSNSLSIQLVGLIDIYDKLVSQLKLMNLAGFFEETQDYFANIKRIQKIFNQTASSLINQALTLRTPY